MYRLSGIIGYSFVSIIILWIMITAVYQGVLFPSDNITTTSDALNYYTAHKGYFGLDHGSKSVIFILSSLLPISLFMFFYSISKHIQPLNMLALISGAAYFIILSLSFMIQAVTAEYSIYLFDTADNEYSRMFAVHLFDWTIENGGISISTYIISSFCQGVWIFSVGRLFLKEKGKKKFNIFSTLLSFLFVLSAIVSFLFLIFETKNINTIREIVDFIFVIWILYISTLLFKTSKS